MKVNMKVKINIPWNMTLKELKKLADTTGFYFESLAWITTYEQEWIAEESYEYLDCYTINLRKNGIKNTGCDLFDVLKSWCEIIEE